VSATSSLALEGRGDRPLTAVTASPPAPDPALLDEVAERIAASPRGLILCGRQTEPGLAAPVVALAGSAGYPVLAEPTSQLRLGSHDRSMVVSTYDPIARVRPQRLEPELVIRFGDMPTSKALRQWVASLDELRQLVVDPRFGWNEPSRQAESLLRCDSTAVAAGLAERLGSAARAPGWAGAWLDAARAAEQALGAELDGLERLTEPGVHRAIGGMYADGDLVYTASSMPIRDQEAFLAASPAEVRFLCNRGANGIDGLISSGIGAAAATGRPTWILVGDLGLYHDMNGLATLREVASPVRIVVLNNGGGGIFEFLPQAGQIDRDEFEALFGTPVGLDVQRIAALHGIRYARAEQPAELAPALREAPVIVEVPVDRSENVELHRRLLDRATRALAVDPSAGS
jgi:2-succinyl-5-enolpyruvyl-6-hydroxy-3-cyclohexene-1-carboxylate synthase